MSERSTRRAIRTLRAARIPFLLIVATLLHAAGATAQGQEERADSVLTATARTLAAHWATGEASGFAPHLATEGIRLQLDGPARAATPPRQAVAAIRVFLDGYREGAAEISRAVVAGGTDDRGFVEIRWTALVAGTSQEVEHTLFLSLARSEDRWRVEELRLLR